MKILKLSFVALCCVAFFGCANKMALSKGQSNIDTAGNSIVLLPVKVSNKIRSVYQPDLQIAYLEGKEAQRVAVNDGLFKEEKETFKDSLLSFSLKPGSYTLTQITGNYMIPFFLNANCVIPVQGSFEVKPNSVTYLGHINAAIVELTTGEEPRAGGLFPLMDQAMAGFSTGTFRVVIEDRYAEDVANYRSEYPGLQGVTIEKAVLTLNPITAAK